jgi:SAM-dependent methyltransferase
MTGFQELVLKSVVALRSRKPRRGARSFDDHAGNIRWQFQSSAALFAKYPRFDVRGRRALEIGCGTGGRTAYLAELGAARAVGIDINRDEIDIARRETTALFPHLASRLEFHACSESGRLHEIGEFDVVVLVDCLEHVVSPPQVLRLAHGYTAPGGRCYASSFGWYHAHGSHFDMVPFVNVLFSDEAILNVQRWLVTRPDYVPHRFDSDPPIERWQGLYDLRQRPGEYLNKLMLRDMKKLVRSSPFSSGNMHVLGWDRRSPVTAIANTLRHVPVVQEMMHSYVILEFVR